MSERAQNVMALLARNPRGITVQQMRGELGLGPNPVKKVLAWLKSQRQASSVRIAEQTFWVTADNLPAMQAALKAHKEAARLKHQRENAIRKRARRIQKKRPGPVRDWPAGESWKPPGPLIPSVWHLPAALGLG